MADLDYADVCIVCGADFGVIPDSAFQFLFDNDKADCCIACGVDFGIDYGPEAFIEF